MSQRLVFWILPAIVTAGCEPDESFAGELAVWDLAGFAYGKHFYKPARS